MDGVRPDGGHAGGAVQIVMSRARGIPKGLAGPIFLSLVITMLLMLALVTELIVRPHPWYAPQLVVPPDRHAAGQHRNRLWRWD